MTFKHWQTCCQCGLVMYNKACLKHNWGQMAESGAKTDRQSICMSTEYQYDCNQESHKCLSDKSFHSACYFFKSADNIQCTSKACCGSATEAFNWHYVAIHGNTQSFTPATCSLYVYMRELCSFPWLNDESSHFVNVLQCWWPVGWSRGFKKAVGLSNRLITIKC